jgi:hypothetical protein
MDDYRVEVRGGVPRALGDEVRRRFGEVAIRTAGDRTVLSGLDLDQAGLRSLLGLIWDAGGELRLVQAMDRRDNSSRRHP